MRFDTPLGALLALLALAAPASAQTLPQTPGAKNAITDVPGIEVGHYTVTNGTGGMTGTTAIIARGGATAGVTQRGGAPGTRLTDLLKSEKAVGTAHAVVLSGGSAYGLAAADGVTTCLAAQGVGTPVANGVIVPIVPSAILFDPGRCAPFDFRPDALVRRKRLHGREQRPGGDGQRRRRRRRALGRRQGRHRHGQRHAAERCRRGRHRRDQFERQHVQRHDRPVLRRLHRQHSRTDGRAGTGARPTPNATSCCAPRRSRSWPRTRGSPRRRRTRSRRWPTTAWRARSGSRTAPVTATPCSRSPPARCRRQ